MVAEIEWRVALRFSEDALVTPEDVAIRFRELVIECDGELDRTFELITAREMALKDLGL
jgi:hypothetical protein